MNGFRSRTLSLVLLCVMLAGVLAWAPTAIAQEDAGDAREPQADFTVSPSRPAPGRNVTASAIVGSKAFDDCRPITLYEWDWDADGVFEANGTGIAGATSRHRFDTPGTFPVTLQVTDACGQTATATKELVVASAEDEGLDFSVVLDRSGAFLRAAWLVVWLSTVAIVAGLPLGVFIGLMRLAPFAPLRWIAGTYIEFLRGTPLLVQIFIVWLALPQISPSLKFSAVTSGLIALIINTSAYQAEIIRAGIQAIPSGQSEAALGMGLSRTQTMRFVILPQALRLVIPPLTNEFIILIKDTSLLSVIGVLELMRTAQLISSRTFKIAEPLIAVAVIYFIMTYSLSLLLQYLERRLAIPGMGMKTGGGAH